MQLTNLANRGRTLEDLIENILADVPGAKLFRQFNKWVPLQNGKRGAFPARGAPIDFIGVAQNVAVALECKEVAKGRRFPLTASRLPKQELWAMQGFQEEGGRALLLVAYWGEGVLTAYPFPFAREKLASGAKSLCITEGVLFSLGDRKDIPPVNALRLVKTFTGKPV